MGGGPSTQSQGEQPTAAPIARLDFLSIYREQFAYVWRTLRRLGVRERDLPDLAHDFFVVVFRQLDRYDQTRPLRPWLVGIAARVTSDYRRSARFTREVLEAPPEVRDEAPPLDEQVATSEARKLVAEVLERLEPDRRTVFVMHDLDDQAMPDIVAALQIPLATGYSRLRLAREDVTQAVKRLRARERKEPA